MSKNKTKNQEWCTKNVLPSGSTRTIKEQDKRVSTFRGRLTALKRLFTQMAYQGVLHRLFITAQGKQDCWESEYQRRRRLVPVYQCRTFWNTPLIPDEGDGSIRKRVIVRPLHVRKEDGSPDDRLPDFSLEMLEYIETTKDVLEK